MGGQNNNWVRFAAPTPAAMRALCLIFRRSRRRAWRGPKLGPSGHNWSLLRVRCDHADGHG